MLVKFIFTLVKKQNFLFPMRIISQIMLDNTENTKNTYSAKVSFYLNF